MDYKELVERLNEWNENLISGLCANDVLTCDDLCGTGDCIVVQAVTAITDLLARAEAAEARAEKAERERDAAVNDLKEEVMGKIWACDYCKKNDPEDFQCKRDDLCGCSEWEWNGGKKEK